MDILKFMKKPISNAKKTLFPDVFSFGKQKQGPTILITAGMDGDEYPGIAAAYRLKTDPKVQTYPGTIHVVPLVNHPGFLAGTSSNPIDRKYPKMIFPGKQTGTDSEQRIHALWTVFGKQADYWIDLHGGARGEKMESHIEGYHTGVVSFDTQTISVFGALNYPNMVLCEWEKVTKIAKTGCFYILLEAGDRGECRIEDVNLHEQWIHSILDWTLTKEPKKPVSYVTHVHYYSFPCDGWWEPNNVSKTVQEKMQIGVLRPFGSNKAQQLITTGSGAVLWQYVGSNANKGEVALAVAEKRISEQ
jgi:uncharacterized protein